MSFATTETISTVSLPRKPFPPTTSKRILWLLVLQRKGLKVEMLSIRASRKETSRLLVRAIEFEKLISQTGSSLIVSLFQEHPQRRRITLRGRGEHHTISLKTIFAQLSDPSRARAKCIQ